MTIDYDSIRRNLWSASAIRNSHQGIGFHANLIPKALNKERTQRFSASFHNERLDMMGMKALQVQRMGMIYHQTLGVLPSPLANIQLRVIALISYSPYKDSIFLSTKLMREHLGVSDR